MSNSYSDSGQESISDHVHVIWYFAVIMIESVAWLTKTRQNHFTLWVQHGNQETAELQNNTANANSFVQSTAGDCLLELLVTGRNVSNGL